MDRNTSDGENIGTTGRGIGPCYRDKVGRSYAVRLGDMYRDTFHDQVRHITAEKNRLLKAMLPADEYRAVGRRCDLPAVLGLCRATQTFRGGYDRILALCGGKWQTNLV